MKGTGARHMELMGVIASPSTNTFRGVVKMYAKVKYVQIKSAFETRENDFSFSKFNEVKMGNVIMSTNVDEHLFGRANIDEC